MPRIFVGKEKNDSRDNREAIFAQEAISIDQLQQCHSTMLSVT